jgi:hypothetical protein
MQWYRTKCSPKGAHHGQEGHGASDWCGRLGIASADFGVLLQESTHGVVVHGGKIGHHDPCALCPNLGLDVEPSDLGIHHLFFSVFIYLFESMYIIISYE